MSDVSELFEKISHPTRVKILKLLDDSPLAFSQLKSKLGIESSGNLDHHIRKLGDLVCLDPSGFYRLSDVGKEAVRTIKFIESQVAHKRTYSQSRQVFSVLLTFLGVLTLATIIVLCSVPPQNLIGLFGALMGCIFGFLGAAYGLKASITVDSRSSFPLTYFPSKNDPWTIGDWITHLMFIGSYLSLLFLLIYAQIFSADFPYKPLWYTISILSLSILFITSARISHKIIGKANKKLASTERIN